MVHYCHLKKLSVGSTDIESLIQWQTYKIARDGALWHDTRNFPKRYDELLAGGSLYWVIKGKILCRQTITDLQNLSDDSQRFCRIMLNPTLIRVLPTTHRPFQGWRYLPHDQAPYDIEQELQDNNHVSPEALEAMHNMGLR